MIEIWEAGSYSLEEIVAKQTQDAPDVSGAVAEILEMVKQKGDEALFEYARRFDKVELTSLRVSKEEIEKAVAEVDPAFMEVLWQAAANIRAFHQKQVRQGFMMAERPGVVMGQRVLPLASVGVYVPGGTAPYPSTVLMDVIPAQIAGVKRIVMVTPPNREGGVNAGILAAARVAGVTDIYKVGGAQAVAALCYGTESIPKVDKIVGPGNIYVATAKRLVYGQVDIDMIAGPSDVLIVADETATPKYLAADMLAQAEHDKNAAAVLVTTSREIAEATRRQLEVQLEKLERREIAGTSLEKNGRIILVDSLEEAMETANALAPEHLELCVQDPFAALPMAKNAGSIFLGHHTPEALGDYFAGPNHTLPTGGTARFYSPLSVDDFVKKSSYLYYSQGALREDGDKVVRFARQEGLTAHAGSVSIRLADKAEDAEEKMGKSE